MNDTAQALLVSGFTIGGGFATFLVGQVALKVMDAANELRSLIAEIDSDLTLYVIDSAIADADERYRIFRRHGARLNAAAQKVIGYSYFEDLFRLPPRTDVLKAARKLLDLALADSDADSYLPAIDRARDTQEEIRTLLRLRSPYSDS
jgi:hypothetical protein